MSRYQNSGYRQSDAISSDLLLILESLKVKVDMLFDLVKTQNTEMTEIKESVLDVLDLLDGEEPEGLDEGQGPPSAEPHPQDDLDLPPRRR